jgi:hypothetical protein
VLVARRSRSYDGARSVLEWPSASFPLTINYRRAWIPSLRAFLCSACGATGRLSATSLWLPIGYASSVPQLSPDLLSGSGPVETGTPGRAARTMTVNA